MNSGQPIGVCDSGVGGTSVVKYLTELLPNEQIIYFGDTARVPYGPRPVAEIKRFMEEIMEFFYENEVKLAVLACNTMTSQALETVRHKFPFPIVGVSSGARSALAATHNKRIGVLATQGTVASGYHAKQITFLDPTASVFLQACPRFVPLVEAGKLEGEEVCRISNTYLEPLKESGVDALILGCTHYPYLTKVIADIMGPEVSIIDPALETVQEAKEVLAKAGMLNQSLRGWEHRYFFSKAPEEAHALVERLMGTSLPRFAQATFGKVC